MDRADTSWNRPVDCGSEGWEFESLRARHPCPVVVVDAPVALHGTSRSSSRRVAPDENEPTADTLATSHVITASDEADLRNPNHVSTGGRQTQMPTLSAQP